MGKEFLSLSDLHNPNKIIGFIHNNGNRYVLWENQGFQEYPGSVELWEKLDDGRLIRIRRWLKKSISFLIYKTVGPTGPEMK